MAKKAAKKKAPAKKPAGKSAKKVSARRSAPARAAAPRKPSYKPQRSQDVIANLVFKDSAAAIEFYKNAFGAQDLMRMPSPDGKGVWHAELRIGDAVLYLNDESPMSGATAVASGGKPTVSLQLYVPDVDSTFNRAVQAGAKATMPPMDMFWGDRMGGIADPFGQVWMISTHVKDLTEEEMRKGGEEFAKKMQQQQAGGGQPPSSAASSF
jgi:uncharacterized glyoxalase superfamily protein PhnB